MEILKPVIMKNIGLVINPGVVFSEIYAEIWEGKFIRDESNIMSHIGRLRKKLGQEAVSFCN